MKIYRMVCGGVLCLSLLLAFWLSGCSNKNGGVTKIKISSWGDLTENKILADMIVDFEKANPDIKVQLDRVPNNEYIPKLLTQISAGAAPDVIFVEVNNFTDLYLRGSLESLNPFIQTDHLDLSTYYPQVVDRFTADGQTYVIPRDTAPIGVVYYNKKAFDEAGVPYPTDDWTWQEFVAAGKKVMKRDVNGRVTRWGFADDWPMPEAWVYDFGGSYVDDVKHPTKWTFATDPKTMEGIQFRADLIYKYKIMLPPSSISDMGGMSSANMFDNGTTAMLLSGIWKTPRYREIKDFNWDVVMLPKGPNGFRAFGTGGSGYGILKFSTHKKEAWKLVKYISGDEGAKRLAATGLAQPAIISVANSPVFLDDKLPHNKKMLFEAVKYVRYTAMCKNLSEILAGVIGPELDRVFNGTETVAEAFKKLKPALEQKPPSVK